MPGGRESLSLRILGSIADTPAADWDACAGADNPFVGHRFLSALEEAGCATVGTGWAPCHLVATDASGRVVGCAPLYLKSHSYGEYVFDWGWAEAYERAGGRYYPKLQCGVPFTPITGPRLLVRPDAPPRTADELAAAMVELARRLGVSSVHVAFPTEPEWRRLGELGFLPRLGEQYHWENRGWQTFDDFLSALSSRKRKAIRKERQAVAGSDLRIRTLVGSEIDERHWDAFFAAYKKTSDGKWGPTYLNRRFFSLLGERLGDSVVLILAERDSRPVAGALNLIGGETLYGRNWGRNAEMPFLHFELCYYRAIEFALDRGLSRVEAGAQGEHKLLRGYLPRPTYSAHWIADPALRQAIARFLDSERKAVRDQLSDLAELAPFRKSSPNA